MNEEIPYYTNTERILSLKSALDIAKACHANHSPLVATIKALREQYSAGWDAGNAFGGRTAAHRVESERNKYLSEVLAHRNDTIGAIADDILVKDAKITRLEEEEENERLKNALTDALAAAVEHARDANEEINRIRVALQAQIISTAALMS